jgi:fucose 4-O-acetylase-like acetyltransferase
MFWVYYGHIVEEAGQGQDLPAALPQQRFVYAFHMVLFVVLSGYLARMSFAPVWAFLRKSVTTRLLPVLAFCVLGLPFYVMHELEDRDEVGATHIRARWEDDWGFFARSITPEGESAPYRAAFHDALPSETRARLAAAVAGDTLSVEEGEAIVGQLNDLFGRRDLIPAGAFAEIGLPADLPRLLQGRDLAALSDDEVRRYNVLHFWKARWPDWNEGGSFWEMLQRDAVRSLRGMPSFNVPVWFLVALFVLEAYHFVAGRWLVGSSGRLLAAIALFGVGGWFVTADVPLWSDIWFARECVLLYAFYLAGLWLHRTKVLDDLPAAAKWALFLLPGGLLAATFNLNPGAHDLVPVVLINLSRHGDPLWFATGAVGGTLMTFGLAQLTARWSALAWVGRRALLFMGVNGFWFAWLNELVVRHVPAPQGHAGLAAWCTAATLLSLALSAPVVWALDRWLPQLMGRPTVAGPLLPPLMAGPPKA